MKGRVSSQDVRTWVPAAPFLAGRGPPFWFPSVCSAAAAPGTPAPTPHPAPGALPYNVQTD